MTSTGPPRRQWLDQLPEDVCERLILHVTGGNPTEAALSLARTSPKLRSAVVATISSKLELPDRIERYGSQNSAPRPYAPWASKWLSDSDYAAAWLELLKDSVVDFTARTKYSKRLTIIEDLLKSPTVQRVSIFDKRTLFWSIGQSRTIRELHLSIRSKKYGPGLFEALSRMNVEKLFTECKNCDSPKSCPFQDASLFNSRYNALAVSCPNLKSLGMWCTLNADDGERDGSTAPVWRIFPELPTLEELAFNGEAPDQAVPKLRELQGVSIGWARGAYRLAMRVGTPIMELVTETPFNYEQVRGLTRCPRLKKVAFELRSGAEVALADAFRELPLLTSIKLHWENRDECEHGDLEGHNCYVDAVPGSMLSAVQAAPKLTVINLTYVRLPLEELQNILNSAGERLQGFTTTIGDQDESPSERVVALLYTAAKSNPQLCSFDVWDTIPEELHSETDEGLGPRFNAAVQRLQRHAPLLDTIRLRRRLADYI